MLSRRVVRYERVHKHWDEIALHSRADGEPYQDGLASQLRAPAELLELAGEALGGLPPELVLFLGTVPVLGDFAYARDFTAVLECRSAGVRLELTYRANLRSGGES